MTIFTRLLEELRRVAAKYRCALIVVGAAALAPLSLGVSEPALAANECGPLDASGSVTCFSTPNPFPTGITYGQPTPNIPLNVTLDSARPRQCRPLGPGNRRSAKQLRRRRTRSSVSKRRNN